MSEKDIAFRFQLRHYEGMTIRSRRLTIRPLGEDDWESLRQVWLDTSRSPYACYNIPHDTDEVQVRNEARLWERENQEGKELHLAILRKGVMIGYLYCGTLPDGWEIGYDLEKQWQHQGYGREAVSALMTELSHRGGGRLVAYAALKNRPSIRLLEDLGFQKHGEEELSFQKGMTFTVGMFTRYLMKRG